MDRKKPWMGVLWGAVILLALTFSAATAQEAETYTDTTDLTDKTRAIHEGLSKLSKSGSLPIFLQFYDTLYAPAQGVMYVLETESGRLEHISDDNGEVLFWVPRRKFSVIKAYAYSHGPIESKSSLATCVELPSLGFFGILRAFLKIRNVPIETGEGMPELKEDGIRVLYPPGHEDDARRVLSSLKQSKAVIDSTLNTGLTPLKVILGESADPKIYVGGALGTAVDPTNRQLFWAIPHEWVETSLHDHYGIYEDPTSQTRWIGDGLANYAAFEIEKRYCPEELSQLYDEFLLGDDPDRVVDLRTWGEATWMNLAGGRSVGAAGYVYAPYFWAKAVEKSGNPELIPEFLEEFRQSEDKSSEAAIAILTELSGLDIEAEMVITGREFRDNVGRYWPEPCPESSSGEEFEEVLE